jgi:hypothetical protein
MARKGKGREGKGREVRGREKARGKVYESVYPP